MSKPRMNIKQAVSWMKQPGIKAMFPSDPHSKEAMKIILEFVENEINKTKSQKANFRIYFSSAAGLDFTGNMFFGRRSKGAM